MKTIRIKRISMHYFKGIRNMTVELGDGETEIAGPNAAGKSTIVDAFFWCLWGKNAQGSQKFSAKTLDAKGDEIPNVDHEVSLLLTADGEEQEFRRTLVPEYDGEGRLKGNHSDYYWNDVPMKKGEYDAKVRELISENVFRLVTSPYAFLGLDWQKQRETLMRLAGEVSDDDVKGDFGSVREALKTKTIEEYGKEMAAKLRKVNEAMAGIPERIDEVRRGMPQAPDMEALDAEMQAAEDEKARLEAERGNEAAAVNAANAERNGLLRKVSDLEFRQATILQEAQAKERNEIHRANTVHDDIRHRMDMLAEEAKADRTAMESQQRSIAARTEKLRAMLEGAEARVRELREEWAKVNSSRFSADEYLRCPLYGHTCQDGEACARYDKGQYEALEKFTADRESRLQRINDEGAALKADILQLGGQLKDAEKEMADSKAGYVRRCAERESLNAQYGRQLEEHPRRPLVSAIRGEDIPEWVELGNQAVRIREQLAGMQETVAAEKPERKERIAALSRRLAEIAAEKGAVQRIAEAERRIAELEEELHGLGMQKTALEAEKAAMRDFENARMAMITDRVNARFRIVRWQMFQKQVNGEEVPACICTCGGVPWPDCNDAGRLNAGIDVAHTLAEASGVSVPMFIDGAEKSLSIYNPGGQRILLRVEKGSGLRISERQ